MQRFTLPRDLYHGKGALEALKTLEGKKAIVCVGGGSMKRNGFLDRAVNYLQEAGMEVKLFEGIEPDPSVETVMKGAAVMEEFNPDWIVAMGGGSPIDAAKAMWIKYEYPDITFEDMCKVFGIPKLRKKAHFCAIPSTSGTATEVTAFSIITDYNKGIKYPIADFEITPDLHNPLASKRSFISTSASAISVSSSNNFIDFSIEVFSFWILATCFVCSFKKESYLFKASSFSSASKVEILLIILFCCANSSARLSISLLIS